MKRIYKKDLDVSISGIDTDKYVLVYNEKDWEGGRISEMPLKTKSEFYEVASQLSDILSDTFDFYHEENICVGPFFELSNYCRWIDIDTFNLVQELKQQLKPRLYYMADVKEDKLLIDDITEGNMRYLTQSCFYLPSEKILLQVGHHTAFIAFSENLEALEKDFSDIIKKYDGWHCETVTFSI